jgi:predicted small lipoprotein YifL
MKRLLMALLTCLVIVGVSGCGEKPSDEPPTTQAEEEAEDEA